MIRSRKPRERKKKKPSLSTTLLKWGSVLPPKAKAMQVRLSQLGKSPRLQGYQGQFRSSSAGVILNILFCMQTFWLFLFQWDLFIVPCLFRSLSFGGLFSLLLTGRLMIPYMHKVPVNNNTPQISPDQFWVANCSHKHLAAIWGNFPVWVLGFYHSLWCRMSIHLYCSFPLHSCCLLFPCY